MIFNALNRPYWFSVIFVTIVVQLHLLRNIAEIYYLIYLIAVVATFLFVLRRWKFLSKVEKKAIFYIVAIFLLPIISILPGLFQASYYSVEGIIVGVLRIIFVLPIYLVILSTPSDQSSFNKLFALVASVTFLAALSVPYQFIFGPIDWFAVSSERAGLDRFASLFGSLTALGGVVGFGILAAILANMSNVVRAVFVSGIILGAV